MLRILRNKKTAKKIWIGLAIIIIPAFALWGFVGSNDEKNSSTAGKIFGKNISKLEFDKSLSAVKTAALIRFGDKLPEIEKYFDFQSQAWERLILLHEAKKRRINVSDKEVINEIQTAPYLQSKNGFNQKTYQEVLRYGLRLQPRTFEEQTLQNLILIKLYKQITEGIKLSDDQIRQGYLKANAELNIHYIASLFSDSTGKIKPSAEEIAAFYEKNKAMFKVPPAKNAPVRIPELAEIKDKVKAIMVQEEAMKMAESKIKECQEKLKTEDFNQAAKASGLKSSQTAFFKSSGQIENLGSAEIFWEAAEKLKNNESSDILTNENGFYIIRLGSIKPIDEDKFTKEKQDFSKKLLLEKKSEAFAKFTEALIKKAL